MQCWNCGFENLPGLPSCARCASTLNLDGVNVEPPRARALRVATRAERVRHRAVSLLPNPAPLLRRLRFLLPEPLSGRALAWSFIPGLGHLKTGRYRLGRWLLPIWLVFLLATVLAVGTSWRWLFWTGMIATHGVAIVSLFAANLAFERLLMRAAFGLLVFFVLRFCLYQPAEWACTRFCCVLPLTNVLPGDLIGPGDAVVYKGRWLKPDRFARGDLVVYRIEPVDGPGYIIRPGFGIDRIVGMPGDRVQITKGRLLVNGAAPPESERPLGAVPAVKKLNIQLYDNEYAIFPTRLNLFANTQANPDLETMYRWLCVVAHEEVLGHAVLRLRPWSRFGSIE